MQPAMPGHVTVLIGDMLERWTNGFLTATLHAVRSPTSQSPRHSLVFFAALDDSVCVFPLNASRVYPSIGSTGDGSTRDSLGPSIAPGPFKDWLSSRRPMRKYTAITQREWIEKQEGEGLKNIKSQKL